MNLIINVVNKEDGYMRISPINCHRTNFNANLFVDKSAEAVIESNRDEFQAAANMYDAWLRHDKANVPETVHIRKNTALFPNKVNHMERITTYDYPYEEGYTYNKLVSSPEDLEFQVGDRKEGFWFNPKSDKYKLLEDFKNMFNYLHGDK